MADDLVARLRGFLRARRNIEGRTYHPSHPDVLIVDAADRIEALDLHLAGALAAGELLRRRAEALEAALRGVIQRHDDYMAATSDLRARRAMQEDPLGQAVERARAALGQTPQEDGTAAG